MKFDAISGDYFPILYFNDYWNLQKDYFPINDSLRRLPFRLSFCPLSLWRWQLYAAQSSKSPWNFLGEDLYEQSDEEQDSVKVSGPRKRLINQFVAAPKMAALQDGRPPKWPPSKMATLQNGRPPKWPPFKMAALQDGRPSRWPPSLSPCLHSGASLSPALVATTALLASQSSLSHLLINEVIAPLMPPRPPRWPPSKMAALQDGRPPRWAPPCPQSGGHHSSALHPKLVIPAPN